MRCPGTAPRAAPLRNAAQLTATHRNAKPRKGLTIDRSIPHPRPCDLTHAEVRRVLELELAQLPYEHEQRLDAIVRVAVALGARAHGALSERMHGPMRPLDGSAIADNPTPWRKR